MARRTRHPAAIEQHPIVAAHESGRDIIVGHVAPDPVPRHALSDKELKLLEEIRADAERHISANLPRPARSTVPYTEPGPTSTGTVQELQREAEEAYRLIQAAGMLLEHCGGVWDSKRMDLLDRLSAHVQAYEERYRKGGGR